MRNKKRDPIELTILKHAMLFSVYFLSAALLVFAFSPTIAWAAAPTAPTNLTATMASSRQINLSWKDNATTEINYYVERSPNGSSSWTVIATLGANVTSYQNTGLTQNTAYYYRVRCKDATTYSSYSNTANAMTATLAAPTALFATVASASSINLAWTDNTAYETNYYVERSPNGTSSWTVVATVATNVTTTTNTGLTVGTAYYYRVRAYDSTNYSAYSSVVNQTIRTIAASAGSNGAIAPSGTVGVANGSTKAFTMTPNTGYKIATVTVDGSSVATNPTYTFSNITANHTIAATFSAITYTITASAGANGTISPVGAVSVVSGATKTFTMTPNTGYKIATVTVDGSSVATNPTYTFSNITANHTIAATFSAITYTITASAGANGTISPVGAVNVVSGATKTFAMTPNTGYYLSNLSVDGSSVATASTYTFTNVTANHTISATFSASTYTITASAGANGTISPVGAVNVVSGATKTFAMTPNTGYYLSNLSVDGSSVATASTYTFTNVTANHTIAATFSAITYTITASAGANGTISPVGTVNVVSGATKTFAMTANTGYYLSNLSVDGSSVATASTYTFTNVTANHTIAATFSAITYTITASAGANGTISPVGVVNVISGATKTFAMTPNTGYYLSNLSVDGSSVVTSNTYTFTNVNANHTISATFSASTYTITASAGANGSISPLGIVSINSGATMTFTITPNVGYRVSDVLVDSVSKGTITSYPFTNVNANHSIAASFADVTPPTGSVIINNGAAYTNSTTVTLTLSATDTGSGVSQMQFSNDNITWSTPEAFATTKGWTLTTGDGAKTAYAKFKDNAGNWTLTPYSSSITLDMTSPVTTASPIGGYYSVAQNVTLSTNETASTYYTTDGTQPTTNSPVYQGPISITATATLKFLSRDLAGNNETITSMTYTIGVLMIQNQGTPSSPYTLSAGGYDSITIINSTVITTGSITATGAIGMTNSTLITQGTVSANNIALTVGSNLTLSEPSSNTTSTVDITAATSISIDSTSQIDVTGKGYLGAWHTGNWGSTGCTYGNTTDGGSIGSSNGGSYGGLGGVLSGGSVNAAYGDLMNPNEVGSGGGGTIANGNGFGGNGGGLVKITAGTLQVDGSIIADGGSGNGGYAAGSGSGGGINIHVSTLFGAGAIHANGGASGNGGGGGGGRIAVYYDTMTLLPTNIVASGGKNGNSGTTSYNGGAGTVYLKGSSQLHGNLTINNGGVNTTNTTAVPGGIFSSVTTTGGASISMTGNLTTDSDMAMSGSQLTISGGLTAPGNVTMISSSLSVSGALMVTGNLTLQNNSVLTHGGATATTAPELDIQAANVTVDNTSQIDVTGKGYLGAWHTGNWGSTGCTYGNTTVGGSTSNSSGGSYGGLGAALSGGSVNAVYGDLMNPNEVGSGGGGYSDNGNGFGGNGGGLVKITSGTLQVDGSIIADGGSGNGGYAAGSGSGGGINIHVSTLFGAGAIHANGGASGNGGGGGGGRIAVYYDTMTLLPTNIVASGGKNGNSGTTSYNGGAGTVYLKGSSQLHGNLTINNGGVNTTNTTAVPGGIFSSVTTTGGASISMTGNLTTDSDMAMSGSQLTISGGLTAPGNVTMISSSLSVSGALMVTGNLTLQNNSVLTHGGATATTAPELDIQAANVTVDNTSQIDVTGKGYLGAWHTGNWGSTGCTYGNTTVGGSTSNSSGGSYGGLGAALSGGSVNAVYGDLMNPNEVGSGGGGYSDNGNGFGGNGGGLVKITSGTLQVDGSIIADGGSGNGGTSAGSGSGGGINIRVSTLSGSGTIHANGGASAYGGGGGGGRIAIYYEDTTITLPSANILAAGGSGSINGSPGTVYYNTMAYAALWHMDGNWTDATGNGNNGTAIGSATFSTDERVGSNAGSFDGLSSAVSGPNNNLPSGSSARTITAWIKTIDANGNKTILDYGSVSQGSPQNYLLALSNGIAVTGNGDGFGTISGTTVVTDGKWHLVAGVYEGSSTNIARIYVDGAQQNAGPITQSATSGNTFVIGQLLAGGSTFSGLIDELAVYNRALSAGEILDIYNTPPSVGITSPAPGRINNRPLLVYTTSSSTDIVTVKVDGSVVSIVSGARLNTLSDGPHTVRVEAVNTVSYISYAQVSIFVDSTPPAFTIDPVITPTSLVSQTITGTIESGGTIAVATDTGAYPSPVSYPTVTTWSCLINQLATGVNNITVTATNAIGTSATATTLITSITTSSEHLTNVAVSSNTIDVSASGSTTIFFTIDGAANVILKIIPEKQGPDGVPVYTATQTCGAAGAYLFTWDGKNSAGQFVPDEAYLYILESVVNGTRTGIYSPPTPSGTASITCSVGPTYDPNKNIPLQINYTVAQPSRVEVDVLNILHQRIPLVVGAPRYTGAYLCEWNGRDNNNYIQKSGTPLCTATPIAENVIITSGMIPVISAVKIDPYAINLSYGQFTSISYTLATYSTATVTVQISSPSNRIYRLASGQQNSGQYTISWPDLTTDTGNRFPFNEEGYYMITIQAVSSGNTATARGTLYVQY